MASNENLEHKEFNIFDEDLIDLKNIFYLIIKNKKLLGLFAIFGIFIGSILRFLIKIFGKAIFK